MGFAFGLVGIICVTLITVTMGAALPGLTVLGSLAALGSIGGSVAGTIGLGAGIITTLSTLSGVLGAIKRHFSPDKAGSNETEKTLTADSSPPTYQDHLLRTRQQQQPSYHYFLATRQTNLSPSFFNSNSLPNDLLQTVSPGEFKNNFGRTNK